MAYATHSPEARFERFLTTEKTTPTFVAALASVRKLRGLSQSRLSQVQRGVALEYEAAKSLNELMTLLERLRDACGVIPVRFHNALDIDALLRLMEQDRLQIIVVAPVGE
jgi:hypothetical protein